MKTSLNLRLSIFTLSRLVVNTSSRMVYPFLAVFATGLNVEIGTISLAMAVSMATSALGPFLAPIADQRGRKVGMLSGMAIFLAGMLAASLFPSLLTFFIAIIAGNLGNNVMLPAMQAYLGDHTPYEKRGFYLAVIELSWALSFILFVPLAGLILRNTLWNGPFIALFTAGVVMTALIGWLVPNDKPAQPEALTIFKDIKNVLTYGPALVAMAMGLTFILGNELVNVVFGVWMQDAYGLQIAALGAASVVIGLSELGGEGLAAWMADHLGKQRSITIGLLVNGGVMLALPMLGKTQVGAFVWLFIFYLTFEVAIISALPLVTEVAPKTRATMMALFIASLSLGRAFGDLLGPWLYEGGIFINALSCLALDLVALLLLKRLKIPQITNP